MKLHVNEQGATEWRFTKAELVALLAFMSTDETRPSIACLAFDQEGKRVWATDGHRGAMLQGGCYEAAAAARRPIEAVPRAAVQSALDGASAKDVVVFVGPGKSDAIARFQVSIGPNPERIAISFEAATIGELPNNLPVVMPPKVEQGTTATFNGRYLADFALVAKACPPTIVKRHRGQDKLYPGVALYPPKDALSPMLGVVECPANGSEWRLVLMPMRA